MGVLNWAYRPLPRYILFAGPWYQWRWQRVVSKSLPSSPKLKNLLLDTLVLCSTGWHSPLFHPPHFCSPLFFCDAANIAGDYQVGIFGPLIGCRILICPKWVQSQQVGEFYGVVETIKIALHLGLHTITLIGDNMATLYSILKIQPFFHHWTMLHQVRNLFNFMWEKHILLQIWWCPTDLMPADPLSRVPKTFSSPAAQQAIFDTESRFKNLLSNLSILKFVGEIHL